MSTGSRHDHGGLICSFCGKTQREVRKLIAGPRVYICDGCIKRCNQVFAEELGRRAAGLPGSSEKAARTDGLIRGAANEEEAPCSFCGKTQTDSRAVAIGAAAHICSECIGLCKDIIAEDFSPR